MVKVHRAERELLELSPEEVVASKQNPRGAKELEPGALKDLRDSMRKHGLLQPIIVSKLPGKRQYRLVEGERRWRVAKELGLQPIPAYVIEPLDGRDEAVAMYHLHTQRKDWDAADTLRAIEELQKAAPRASYRDLAEELGMSQSTLRNRLRVLDMGPDVLRAIERGELGFIAAVRAAETAALLARTRQRVTKELGGEQAVRGHLVEKGKRRKGLGPELVALKSQLSNPRATSDDVVKSYVVDPEATKADVVVKATQTRPRGRTSPAKGKKRSQSSQPGDRMVERIRGWRRELDEFARTPREGSDHEALKAELALLIEKAESLERELLVEEHLAPAAA